MKHENTTLWQCMDLLALRLVRPGTTDDASDNTSVVVGRKVIKARLQASSQCDINISIWYTGGLGCAIRQKDDLRGG